MNWHHQSIESKDKADTSGRLYDARESKSERLSGKEVRNAIIARSIQSLLPRIGPGCFDSLGVTSLYQEPLNFLPRRILALSFSVQPVGLRPVFCSGGERNPMRVKKRRAPRTTPSSSSFR